MTERFYSPVIKYTTNTLKTLPGALLYFYETGTSTPKTTWSDPERQTESAHPVPALADGTFPPIFINGVYRVELKSAAGVTQPGWPVDDVGSPAAGFPFQSWSSTYSYSEDDLVTYGGEFYQSLADANVGNTPSTSPAFWQKKLFLDAPTAESYLNGNADGTYTWLTIAQTKSDLSLPTDTVSELALKAPLASPAFTGNPTAPTPSANDNDTSIATTAYVQTELLDRVQTVATIADLRALTGLSDGQHISVASHTGGWAVTVPYRGPKGGGVFVAQASDVTSTDDNGKVIVTADGMRCIRNSNQVWVEDFGALGDGSTIDSVAIQAAHDSLPATGGQVNFGEGKFVFDDPLEITKVGVNLVGRGIQASQLLPYSLATTSIIKIGNAGGVTLQLQMRDFGFRGFTTLAPIANWTGIAIDCTSYPLIDSTVENLWFSMSFDTPYCIKGVLSSSTIKNCIFELAGGSIYAHSVSGVGSVYNSVVEGCIFWRTIGAVRLGLGTGTRASLEIRDLDIGSHYSGAGIYVESGDLTASDIRFDVNTQWTGSTSRALRLDGGTANVSELKVRKIVNGAAGSDLAEAIYMQGDSSLTLNGGSLHNATYGISSTSTGELIVNGTDLQDLSEHGIYPATNNLSRQIIKNATFTRIGLGAGANKDACRIKADYGVVSGCTFYDDGTSLMRHVIIDSTTTTAEVLPDNTYFGGEGGSPVISSSTGCRAEFPLSTAPAFGSWAVGSMVRFTAPAAAGKIGSVCVTAGSPGTWKSYGAIDP